MELLYEEFEIIKVIKNWLEEKNIIIIDFNLEIGIIVEVFGNKNGLIVVVCVDIDVFFI